MQTRADILKIQEKISKEMDSKHAEIFSAHLLVLEDRMLIEEVITRVKKEKLAVEYIFFRRAEKLCKGVFQNKGSVPQGKDKRYRNVGRES